MAGARRSDVIAAVCREVDGYRYADYLRSLPTVESALADPKPLRVAILRSYTLEPIEPVLKLRLMLDGFAPDVWIGGYNQYHVEALDPGSRLHAFEPDLVLVMVRLEEVLPDFVDDFASRSLEAWADEVDRASDELVGIVRRVAQETGASVVVQNVSAASEPYFGVFDAQRRDGQRQLIHRFNRSLAGATESPGVFIWDFDAFVGAYGAEQLFDAKTWYVSRNPFKQSAYPRLVADLMRYVRSALGRLKKCVVLDLDNTLWGGVVGEDGFEGIALGDSYPGSCYKAFQKRLLRLYHRGILLAINSKNNEADALRVIDEHPDMLLRRKHFAAMRINWQDKASNMLELAAELNIGVDSFVFLDDNPAECAWVEEQVPGCDVVQIPAQPYLVPAIVDALPAIENIRLTDEDRKKGEMYQAQAARRAFEQGFAESSLEDFLRKLEMQVSIDPADPFSIPRIAQLTQKTNQFNVTTRRYTEAQIQAFVSDPSKDVYSVAAKDRFGDHGIIGVLILEHAAGGTRIDTFLLSCRVIGRGIEGITLDFADERARERGSERLIGEFIPTAKNAPAATLYEGAAFTRIDDTRWERPLDR